jgi:hypothetical protein
MAVWLAPPTAAYDFERGRWMVFEWGRWRAATPHDDLPSPDLARERGDRALRFVWISEHRLGWTLLDADGYRVEPW